MEKLREPQAVSSSHVQGAVLREQKLFTSRESPSMKRPCLVTGMEKASSSQVCFKPPFLVAGAVQATCVCFF